MSRIEKLSTINLKAVGKSAHIKEKQLVLIALAVVSGGKQKLCVYRTSWPRSQNVRGVRHKWFCANCSVWACWKRGHSDKQTTQTCRHQTTYWTLCEGRIDSSPLRAKGSRESNCEISFSPHNHAQGSRAPWKPLLWVIILSRVGSQDVYVASKISWTGAELNDAWASIFARGCEQLAVIWIT